MSFRRGMTVLKYLQIIDKTGETEVNFRLPGLAFIGGEGKCVKVTGAYKGVPFRAYESGKRGGVTGGQEIMILKMENENRMERIYVKQDEEGHRKSWDGNTGFPRKMEIIEL